MPLQKDPVVTHRSRPQIRSKQNGLSPSPDRLGPSRLWAIRGLVAGTCVLLGILGLPWWTLLVPAVMAGMFLGQASRSFFEVGLTVALIWALAALYQDFQAGGRVSLRISSVLTGGALGANGMGVGFGPLAYLITSLVAGLAAGLAAWCGQTLRQMLAARA